MRTFTISCVTRTVVCSNYKCTSQGQVSCWIFAKTNAPKKNVVKILTQNHREIAIIGKANQMGEGL